jgi:hypothetical protein
MTMRGFLFLEMGEWDLVGGGGRCVIHTLVYYYKWHQWDN